MLEDAPIFFDVLYESGIKLGMALLCGFLLGMEREMKDKPAGLRTLILIAVGAALYMIVSDLIARVTEGPEAITRVDPSRMASQVVSGIGFLGAGAIIQSRGSIRGLTTAATIWVAAGIGLCIGAGFPLIGLAITVLVLVVLVVLDPVRAWFSRRGTAYTLSLLLPDDDLIVKRIRTMLRDNDIPARNISLQRDAEGPLRLEVTYHAHGVGKQDLLEALATVQGVRGATLARPVQPETK